MKIKSNQNQTLTVDLIMLVRDETQCFAQFLFYKFRPAGVSFKGDVFQQKKKRDSPSKKLSSSSRCASETHSVTVPLVMVFQVTAYNSQSDTHSVFQVTVFNCFHVYLSYVLCSRCDRVFKNCWWLGLAS